MTPKAPNDNAASLALQALAATLADDKRAQRLLALTGLTADELRARLGDRGLLAACLTFLESYEPDLIAVASDLDVPPEHLVAARHALEAS
ncbi:MAG: DUF3572 family protein [Sphingomonas sp.]|nr:DUF3572 family protein [Sphingomonas sp.]RZV52143.1 MAG: DUF3572 family protein [Sphingomonadaceae bacterium]